MADRSVLVRLRADISDFQRKFAMAGAETKAVAREMDSADKSVGNFEKSSKSASKEVDKLSGRLGLARDALVILGPAALRLGAGSIPILTASLQDLGAGAGAIGVMALAISGLGDGIKALDAYNLSPTVENLQKLKVVEEQLGPAGTHFIKFLDDLEPHLRDLQQTARDGWFPGLETGIDDLLGRMPLVKATVKSIADELGSLSSSAGHALSSSEWRPFFQYVRQEAAPTLDAFAHSAGNVALGLANLLVAFSPASDSFSGGLEEMTQRFADWSKTLDSNKSFQNFLAYVRESGPQVVQLMGAVIDAVVGLAKAAAPLGSVTLPALTGLLHLFGQIANSKIGPALYTAAAAMLAYNRATKLTAETQKKFQKGIDGLTVGKGVAGLALIAASTTDYTHKLGLANTAQDALAGFLVGGPWGAAVGLAVGQYQDLSSATDKVTASVTAANDALDSGDTMKMATELKALQAQLDAVPSGFAEFKSGFASWQAAADARSVLPGKIQELKTALQEGGGAADIFGRDIGFTGNQMSIAAGDATTFSGALADLNGWFDKRQAVRDYRTDITNLSKALKDGFQPKDAETLDTLGRGIIQVANSIKDKGTRDNFLAGARAQLEQISKSSGPAAQKALQQVIDKFDDTGLTHPKPIKPTVDPSDVDHNVAHITGQFDIMSALESHPKVRVDPGNSLGLLGQIEHAITSLRDKTIHIQTVHTDTSGVGYQHGGGGGSVSANPASPPPADTTNPGHRAGGGLIRGAGGPTDDRVPLMGSNGEFMMRAAAVQKYGVGFMSDVNSLHLAGGGYVGDGWLGRVPAGGGSGSMSDVDHQAHGAADGLKSLKERLADAAKAIDKEKTARQNLIQAEQDFASTVGAAYAKADPFAGGLSDFDTAVSANTNDTNSAQAALAQAKSEGLSGALYKALASSGNLLLDQQFAALTPAQIAQREAAFNTQNNAENLLGTSAAKDAGFPELIKAMGKKLDAAEARDKALTAQIKQVQASVKQGAEDGTRAGIRDTATKTRNRVRTGG